MVDGQNYSAAPVAVDVVGDLAVLQVQESVHLTPALLGDSNQVQVGDRVASIGNGYGQGLGIGAGPVTRLGVTIAPSSDGGTEPILGMIEAHTDLRAGASGGAMVNTAGEVIGIDTANGIIPGTSTPNGYGYAIPIHTAMAVVHELVAGN